MKTTLDLPDELVRQMKLRALNEGRKLKDAAAELLRRGLAAEAQKIDPKMEFELPHVKSDTKTGLPVIECKRTARRSDEMTPQRVAEILSGQEAEWNS